MAQPKSKAALVRAVKIRLGQRRVSFRGLPLGTYFRFASEEDEGLVDSHTPWIRLGKLRFRRISTSRTRNIVNYGGGARMCVVLEGSEADEWRAFDVRAR